MHSWIGGQERALPTVTPLLCRAPTPTWPFPEGMEKACHLLRCLFASTSARGHWGVFFYFLPVSLRGQLSWLSSSLCQGHHISRSPLFPGPSQCFGGNVLFQPHLEAAPRAGVCWLLSLFLMVRHRRSCLGAGRSAQALNHNSSCLFVLRAVTFIDIISTLPPPST